VRFPVTGPLRYTLTAHEAVELCELIKPRTIIPIHYEGWKHFREGREAIEDEFAKAPTEIRDSVQWLPIGG
jgi:L-ascorbate metabolism protein UlaG (beta-lactamase superfamily)